jgi:hypothetical protein
MNETVAVLLIHIKIGCMIFPGWVILQINQNEEQAVFNRGKRAVFVYGKSAPVIAVITCHIVMGQIPVMRFLETGKQGEEPVVGKTRQRTEVFFACLIIGIFHDAKVRMNT